MENSKKLTHKIHLCKYEHAFIKESFIVLKSTTGQNIFEMFIPKNTIKKYYAIRYIGNYLKVTKQSHLQMCDFFKKAYLVLDPHKLYHIMTLIINDIIDRIPFGQVGTAPLRYSHYIIGVEHQSSRQIRQVLTKIHSHSRFQSFMDSYSCQSTHRLSQCGKDKK